MNTALWMLYFADVATSISGVLIAVAIACCVAACIWWLVRAIYNADCRSGEELAIPPRWLYVAALGCAVTASLIPSKETFYAIAAANVGDAALHTQTGDKAIRALDAWLDRQIAGDDGKGK